MSGVLVKGENSPPKTASKYMKWGRSVACAKNEEDLMVRSYLDAKATPELHDSPSYISVNRELSLFASTSTASIEDNSSTWTDEVGTGSILSQEDGLIYPPFFEEMVDSVTEDGTNLSSMVESLSVTDEDGIINPPFFDREEDDETGTLDEVSESSWEDDILCDSILGWRRDLNEIERESRQRSRVPNSVVETKYRIQLTSGTDGVEVRPKTLVRTAVTGQHKTCDPAATAPVGIAPKEPEPTPSLARDFGDQEKRDLRPLQVETRNRAGKMADKPMADYEIEDTVSPTTPDPDDPRTVTNQPHILEPSATWSSEWYSSWSGESGMTLSTTTSDQTDSIQGDQKDSIQSDQTDSIQSEETETKAPIVASKEGSPGGHKEFKSKKMGRALKKVFQRNGPEKSVGKPMATSKGAKLHVLRKLICTNNRKLSTIEEQHGTSFNGSEQGTQSDFTSATTGSHESYFSSDFSATDLLASANSFALVDAEEALQNGELSNNEPIYRVIEDVTSDDSNGVVNGADGGGEEALFGGRAVWI